jgi:hypothetical protein
VSGSTGGSKPVDILLEEWKEARNIIDSLDTLLSGLRKYGFTFITALLGADSILGQATGLASFALSPLVKLGVMVTTLALIIGLYATDSFYRMIQKGAATSAKAIEGIWEPDSHVEGPTKSISKVYRTGFGWVFIDFLYILFGLATLILGVFILFPDYDLVFWLFIASFLVGAFGYGLQVIASGGHTDTEITARKFIGILFGRTAKSKST